MQNTTGSHGHGPQRGDVTVTEWSELLDSLVARRRPPGQGVPPFVNSLAMPYPDSWERGRVTSTWPVDERFFNERGVVFGGYLAVLSDHALGMVTMSVLDSGEVFATSDLRTSFFRSVKGGSLEINAEVVHRSRNLVHAEVVLATEDGELVAKATAIAGHPATLIATSNRDVRRHGASPGVAAFMSSRTSTVSGAAAAARAKCIPPFRNTPPRRRGSVRSPQVDS